MEKDRWQMRHMLPLLVEPRGQRVILQSGERGKMESLTDVGTRLAYIIILDSGERRTVFATDLDLDVVRQ